MVAVKQGEAVVFFLDGSMCADDAVGRSGGSVVIHPSINQCGEGVSGEAMVRVRWSVRLC